MRSLLSVLCAALVAGCGAVVDAARDAGPDASAADAGGEPYSDVDAANACVAVEFGNDASTAPRKSPTCSAGTLASDGGACQACGQRLCSEPSCDDGSRFAESLADGSLECQFNGFMTDWYEAMRYACAGFGTGYRLATRGEALRIAANPRICRPINGVCPRLDWMWWAWTSTCVEGGHAWVVGFSGLTYSGYGGGGHGFALCVR